MSPRKDDRNGNDRNSKDDRNNPKSETRVESRIEYDDKPIPLTQKEKNVLEFLEMFIRESGISPSYQEICNHFGFASFNSVQRYLKQLEAKGYIRLPGSNQKRAITILRSANAVQETLESVQTSAKIQTKTSESGRPSLSNVIPAIDPVTHSNEVFILPMLGRVAAGSPIEAYEHDEFIDVPASLVRHADRTYALRVQGQSMIEDGILDGDVILVQRQASAGNGEIVVAMIGEEATVKRFYTHTRDTRDITESSTERALDSKSSRNTQKMIELRPANANMASLWFQPDEVQIRGIVVGLIRKF